MNFSEVLKSHPSRFSVSYSTRAFPLSLKDLFSSPPHGGVTAETSAIKNGNLDINKKAKILAELVNTKPWSPALESRLGALLPLSQTTFFQIMRRMQKPLKALRFFNWTKNSGFAHNHHSYFMMLEILGRNRNLNTARNFLFSIPLKTNSKIQLTDKLFNSLIRSYGNAGLFQESMKIFSVMKSMAISPSTFTFNSLLMILMKRGRLGMAFQLYDELLRTYGVKPDLCTFNVLIKGCCSNSRTDIAFRMFKEMDDYNCEPDLVTYNILVDGLCKAGKVEVAHNVVKGMMLKKREDLRPNVVTYTALLRGYCAKQQTHVGLDLLREMIDAGVQPNNVTYNTLIHGLCESKKLGLLKEALGEDGVKSMAFSPDTYTFNILMNALCSCNNLDEASKTFERMKELNVARDSATFCMLIRAFCRNGVFAKAEELLDELLEKEVLLQNGNSVPLCAAYNPIFEHLCSNGKTKKADKVLRQLMKRGVQDRVSFGTLITGHCKEGTFVEGHKLLVLMLRRDFKPDVQTYSTLIDGLLLKGKPHLAYDSLLKMLRSDYLPRASVFHRVLTELIRSSSHNAADLMILMLDKDIRPNIDLSTDVVILLYHSRLKKEAFQLIQSIYAKGYMVNMDKLVSFLCEQKKLRQAYELLIFVLTNDERAEISLCNAVLSHLCGAKMFSEAFNLYYELLETDADGPFNSLPDLKAGLESTGKLKQAEFVAKRMFNNTSC